MMCAVEGNKHALPNPNGRRRNVLLGVQRMASRAQREKIRRIIRSLILDPDDVVDLERNDAATDWVGALVTRLKQHKLAGGDRNLPTRQL